MVEILYAPNENTKVIIKTSQQTRDEDPRIESRIEKVWQRKQKAAQRTDRNLWNGDTYRLSSWDIQNPDTLVLGLGNSTYRETLATHEAYPKFIDRVLGPDFFANTIVVTGSLLTSDDFFVIGKRSKGVIESGKYGTFGGSLDRKQESRIKTIENIGQAFEAEIEEELGIKSTDLSSVLFLGLTKDSKFYPQLHFIGRIPHPLSWVLDRFGEVKDDEHQSILGIPAAEITKLGVQFTENGSDALKAHLLLLTQKENINETLKSIPVLQVNQQP